jgi:hypothetical protein
MESMSEIPTLDSLLREDGKYPFTSFGRLAISCKNPPVPGLLRILEQQWRISSEILTISAGLPNPSKLPPPTRPTLYNIENSTRETNCARIRPAVRSRQLPEIFFSVHQPE